MRIITEKGEFDLPVELETMMNVYNQAFNDLGEQTIPMTLPDTPNNLLLISYSHRLDAFYKPIKSIKISVIDGIFFKPGTLVIHNVNREEGISCTLYFNEGNFYSMIDEQKMNVVPLDKFSDPNISTPTAANLNQRVQYLISLLKSEYKNKKSDFYSVFPLKTSTTVTRKCSLINPDTGEIVEYTEDNVNFFLNGFETNVLIGNFENTYIEKFAAENKQIFVNGSDELTVNEGYGMTAFVNLFYYLHKMFNHFGYTFNDTDIKSLICGTNTKVVIGNNVADAIYDGLLDLNQLLPDIFIKEFLSKVSTLLAGIFYVDDTIHTVRFCTYTKIFKTVNPEDLSKYISSNIKIENINFNNLDINDTSVPELSKKKNVTYLDVTFAIEEKLDLLLAPYYIYKNVDRTNYNSVPGFILRKEHSIPLKIVSGINNIVHMNSSVVKNSEINEEKESDSTKDLILIGVRNNETEKIVRTTRIPTLFSTFKFERGYSSIYNGSNLPVEKLRILYKEYFQWNKNSGIAVSCGMCIPSSILYRLDLSKQYLLNGNPFLIDKIEYLIPYNGKQKVTFRTVRDYADRP